MPTAVRDPLLVVLSGLPGTGKSTIADGLARTYRLPVLSVDPIESAIVRAGISASFETGLAAYLVVETIADRYLAARMTTVVDAVNSVEPAREMWRTLARRHRVPMPIIECVVSDRSMHLARLASRNRSLAIREPGPEDVERRRREWRPWPEPCLTLDAMADPEANLARAIEYLGLSRDG